MQKQKTTKNGATSIYVVVISALLFSVITVSFVKIITKEANRSTSDELSQSAYDSALAGVEDARIAIKAYNDCRINTDGENCTTVINAFSNLESGTEGNCDMVAKALGRIRDGEEAHEILLQETSGGSADTVQAYTCVSLNTITSDYRGTLSANNKVAVIPLRTHQVSPNDITALKISWFSQENESNVESLSYSSNTKFRSLSEQPLNPPVISSMIIQTATPDYSIDDFESADFSDPDNPRTDRGTVFLYPQSNNGLNKISKTTIAKSNDHSSANTPQGIQCKDSSSESSQDYACSVVLELPRPIMKDGTDKRATDTFYLVLNLPYGQPTTDFTVQMCNDPVAECGDGSIVNFEDVQVSVDSTGRANDMYSRVEARLEFADSSFPYPEFGLLATGDDDDAISKNFYVTKNCWTVNSTGINSCPDKGELSE